MRQADTTVIQIPLTGSDQLCLWGKSGACCDDYSDRTLLLQPYCSNGGYGRVLQNDDAQRIPVTLTVSYTADFSFNPSLCELAKSRLLDLPTSTTPGELAE